MVVKKEISVLKLLVAGGAALSWCASAGTLYIHNSAHINVAGSAQLNGDLYVNNSANAFKDGEPACLSVNNLVFRKTTTFNVKVENNYSDRTACSDYNQITTTGDINLDNSTLSVDIDPSATFFQGSSDFSEYNTYALTLINNSGSEPVTKRFIGLDEGAALDFGLGFYLHLTYAGGDGNDVQILRWDDDNDGVDNYNDAFPADNTEWADNDGDGTGNNADQMPNDATATADSDGDGVSDDDDAFPDHPMESVDSDGDGIGDYLDAFPNDASETTDSDGDGIGDNAETDKDNDGIDDGIDICPLNADTDQKDTDGDGYGDACDIDSDADGYIDIRTVEQLFNIRFNLAGTAYSDYYSTTTEGCGDGVTVTACNGYELMNDLDFDENGDGINNDTYNQNQGWFPIGNATSPLTANIEGNYFSINNLVINNTNLTQYVGFIGFAQGMVVQNIHFSGNLTKVSAEADYVGGLIGAADDIEIYSSSFSGSVSTDDYHSYLGGVVGGSVNNESITQYNFANVSISGGKQYIGGLYGYAKSTPTYVDSYASLQFSGNYANVNIASDGEYIGGLVGLMDGYVKQSYTSGTITGDGLNVGGVLGRNNKWATLLSSSVDVEGAQNVGGLIGYSNDEVQYSLAYGSVIETGMSGGLVANIGDNGVEYSYWDTESTSQSSSAKGTGYSTSAMQAPTDNSGIYSNFLDTLWDFGTDSQYPALIVNGVVYRDSDGDNVFDTLDAFPNDASEMTDTDGDGVGDNSDAFPNDPSETTDTDGDGVGDNSDAFPNDASETTDTDSDGVGDNSDAFPNDASETTDTDGDGVGDNSDAFPNDASETTDTDGDGVGDNSDAFPNDASETTDTDGDGVGDNSDAFPNDSSETTDTDGDGVGDNSDAFPNDASETTDTDGDGVGDNSDAFPNDPSETTDSDGDGVGDNSDAYPNDPTRTTAPEADTTAPVIGDVEDVVVEATGELTSVDLVMPTVTDNVTASPMIESDLTGALALGEHIITWTATDEAGNQATKEQLVSVVDTTAPEFDVLGEFTFEASGVTTDISTLLAVTAFDIVDGELVAEIDGETSVTTGRHQVTLTVTDQSGNSAETQATVDILPEVTIASSMDVEVGADYTFDFELSGEAPSYPVIIAYQLQRNGEVLAQGESHIEAGLTGEIATSIPADTLVIDELMLVLVDAEQAFIGEYQQLQLHVVEDNVAPKLRLVAMQQDVNGKIVDPDLGMVTVTALIDDANMLDSHDINWQVNDAQFVDELQDNDESTFELDPSLLAEGVYTMSVTITESNTAEAFSVTQGIQLVVEQLPPLSSELDTDNDGIVDSEEGYGDSDGDGIADYLDNDSNTSRLPINSVQMRLQTEPDFTLSLGSFVQGANGSRAQFASLTPTELAGLVGGNGASTDDADYQLISPIYNFVIDGLAQAGDSASVIIELETGLPANSMYRKYNRRDGWYPFVEDVNNSIHSAPLTDNDDCPAVNDPSYILGLTEGYQCVQITFEDGSDNDIDFNVNASIEDPGAFVIERPQPVYGNLMLSEQQLSVDESMSVLTITISRVDGDDEEVSVDYQFTDSTATNGEDYYGQNGTLTFADGETSKAIEITIVNDSIDEVDEQFSLTLVNPVNTSVVDGDTVTVTIIDNDEPVKSGDESNTDTDNSGSSGGAISWWLLVVLALRLRKMASS